jgi:zinc transporter 1/2/3
MDAAFDPTNVDLTTADPAQVICALAASQNEYNGSLGARISAIFVIGAVSSAATFFPVLAARVRWLRINIYVYLFARYFGAGVIVATAFIQYVPTQPPSSRLFSCPFPQMSLINF